MLLFYRYNCVFHFNTSAMMVREKMIENNGLSVSNPMTNYHMRTTPTVQ